jgi:predicted Zn-dependent protease
MTTSSDHETDQKICLFLEGVRKRCPDNVQVLETLGDLYTKQGLFAEGLEIDKQLTSSFPDHEMYWYNLACSYSLTGQIDDAVDALKKAVNLGYEDVDWLLKDKDLQSIRKHPDVIALIVSMQSRGI